MPSILKLQTLSNGPISESLFLGGTSLSDQTATSFTTQSGDYTIRFTGSDLTYDAGGMITGGTIEEYRLYRGAIAIETQVVIVSSNFTLLTGAELAHVFALYDAGQIILANAEVMQSWTSEYYSQSDSSGDDLTGTSTDDFLSVSPGGVRVDGLDGNDTIMLGAADGQAFGGVGDDVFYSAAGNDRMYGGTGDDRFWHSYAPRDHSVDWAYGGVGNDSLGTGHAYGGTGNDTVQGGRDADDQYGGLGNDVLQGDRDNDTLYGGVGNDALSGGRGDDVLMGDSGADTLTGGQGVNSLTGGGGADSFVFTRVQATDVITDFKIGQDQIDLSAFRFANVAAVSALLVDTGAGDALLTLGSGQTVLITGVAAADLLADLLL